jgi:hypothetical protein
VLWWFSAAACGASAVDSSASSPIFCTLINSCAGAFWLHMYIQAQLEQLVSGAVVYYVVLPQLALLLLLLLLGRSTMHRSW